MAINDYTYFCISVLDRLWARSLVRCNCVAGLTLLPVDANLSFIEALGLSEASEKDRERERKGEAVGLGEVPTFVKEESLHGLTAG